MHLEAGDIQRALHGELPPDEAAALKRHLDACSECAAAFADAVREEAQVYDALTALDHRAPAISASAVVGAPGSVARRPLVHATWMRWAAALVLGLGLAGVAYAAPGSPLREWIEGLTEGGASSPGPPTPDPAEASGGGGVGVAPGDLLLVELSGVERGAAVRVRFTDLSELQAGGGSGRATFTLEPDRLLVGTLGTDTIELEIPRTAPRVEVRTGGRVIAVAERGALVVDGAPLGGPGPFVLPLAEVSP
jgi:hypothetical protein